jgi:hypothetical protein
VDEDTGKMVEAAASVIGSISGKNASLAKDDDYQTTLTFYCKANFNEARTSKKCAQKILSAFFIKTHSGNIN